MEVQRGRVLLEVGDSAGRAGGVRSPAAGAEKRPDDARAHVGLRRSLHVLQKDWDAAEQAYLVRARAAAAEAPEEQRGASMRWRLGELYCTITCSTSRAPRCALKEVLRACPGRRRGDDEARRRLQASERSCAGDRAATGSAHPGHVSRGKAPSRGRARGDPRADRARQPPRRADPRGRAARVPARRRPAASAGRVLRSPPPGPGGQHPARPRRCRRAKGARRWTLLAAPIRGAGDRVRASRQEGLGARVHGRAGGVRGTQRRAASWAARASARSIHASTICWHPRC